MPPHPTPLILLEREAVYRQTSFRLFLREDVVSGLKVDGGANGSGMGREGVYGD